MTDHWPTYEEAVAAYTPPPPPDSHVCPECGASYPAKGFCYGKPGQQHGLVALTPALEQDGS